MCSHSPVAIEFVICSLQTFNGITSYLLYICIVSKHVLLWFIIFISDMMCYENLEYNSSALDRLLNQVNIFHSNYWNFFSSWLLDDKI